MNQRQLMLVVAALVAGGAALAQSPAAVSRADLGADILAAGRSGETRPGDTATLHDPRPLPSPRSRAEVRAEAIAANAARAGTVSHGDGPLLDRMLAMPSTLSRAQVQAEAIEARRLGLIATGEAEQRPPTPAELESVRQAGLRALGVETLASH